MDPYIESLVEKAEKKLSELEDLIDQIYYKISLLTGIPSITLKNHLILNTIKIHWDPLLMAAPGNLELLISEIESILKELEREGAPPDLIEEIHKRASKVISEAKELARLLRNRMVAVPA